MISSTGRLCGKAIALCALGVGLAFPASASASPSSAGVASDGVLDVLVSGSDTTPHVINISYSGGYLITDSAGITAGAGCVQGGSTSVSCPDIPAGSIEGVAVAGGAGNDSITITSVGPPSPSFLHQTGIFGNGGNDTIVTPASKDLLRGNDGDDTIDGGLGADSIAGGRGKDTVSYATRSQPVIVNIGADPETDPPDGAAGENDGVDVENVIGGTADDVIIGPNSAFGTDESAPGNKFTGGPGKDRLLGLTGGDRLIGGADNDKLFGGAQKDFLKGGPGRDKCVGGKSKDKAKSCEKKGGIP